MHTPPPSPRSHPQSVANLTVNWTPTDFANSMSAKTKKKCHSVQIYSLIYLGASHIVLFSQPNPTNRFSPKLSLPVHEVFLPTAHHYTTTIGELASLTASYQIGVAKLQVGEYAGHCIAQDENGYQSAVVAVIFRVVEKEVIGAVRNAVMREKEEWGAKYVGPDIVSREQAEKMNDMGFGKLKRGVMVGFGYKTGS